MDPVKLQTTALQAYVARASRPASAPPRRRPPSSAADMNAAWRAAVPGAWPCPPRGLGASWDPLLARRLGARAGDVARHAGAEGVRGPLHALATDPLLAGTLAAAWATGVRSAGAEPLFALPRHPDPAQRRTALSVRSVGGTVVELAGDPPADVAPLVDEALALELAGASTVLVTDPRGLLPAPGATFAVHGPGCAALRDALGHAADPHGDIAVALPGLPARDLRRLVGGSDAVVAVVDGDRAPGVPTGGTTILQTWSRDPVALAAVLTGRRQVIGRLAAPLVTPDRTYPFGHGLGAPALTCQRVEVHGDPGTPTSVELQLRNATSQPALEVAQVYLAGPGGTRLCGFARVAVAAAATAEATIVLDADARYAGDADALLVGVGTDEPWVSLRLGR